MPNKWTWKRPEAGHYTSKGYSVKGEGSDWTAFHGRKQIGAGNSKKECQAICEEHGDNGGSEPAGLPEPKPDASLKRRDLTEPRPWSKTDADALASLRLAVDQLTIGVNQIAANMPKLVDALNRQADAMEIEEGD